MWGGSVLKNVFIAQAFDGQSSNRFLLEVIGSYGGPSSKRISVTELFDDVTKTLRCRRMFQTLGCRGFSYEFVGEMQGFPYHLRKQIDLRLALVSQRELFYPKRVRRYLLAHNVNHYFVDAFPAIAFALGRRVGRKWFICIMQSDLAFRGPAYIRDHFRGWRKILFANLMRYAIGAVDEIYLCPAAAVFSGSFPTGLRPAEMPAIWSHIYDGTARFFSMKPVELSRAVNVQIYKNAPPVYCRCFYRLRLTTSIERQFQDLFEHAWIDSERSNR